MISRSTLVLVPTLAFALSVRVSPANAQHAGHMHMEMDSTSAPPGMHDMAHMDGEAHAMPALLGPYPIAREASGTSWQPESAPHRALHASRGPWMLMLHGFAQVVADAQGGPRGDQQVYSTQMLMGMATRAWGPQRLGLLGMMSLEPATVDRGGYPLLLQTGETADGRTPLIDHQHPHDLFMELAATWSVARRDRSLFLYAGLPGEPALGPPVFMHRFSGESFPEAPITHHWLDSSHISYGVVTAGATAGSLKLDASWFRGREPDQDRWNIEKPKLDSQSYRISWNPSPAWALQASQANIESPEQLDPAVDVTRSTASVTFQPRGDRRIWQTTVAWGRNDHRPGPTLDAWLAETALEIADRHTLLGRAELADKDELFPESDPRHSEVFRVGKLSLGLVERRWQTGVIRWGVGAIGTLSFVPSSLQPDYGDLPVSGSVFVDARLR